MHEYVKQGGVRPAAAPEKSKLAIGLDIFTGKSVPSDHKKKDGSESAHTTPTATAVAVEPAPARAVSATAPPAPPAPAASNTNSFQAAKPNPFASGDPFEGGQDNADEDEEEEGGNPFGGPATTAPAAPPAAPPAPPARPEGGTGHGSNFVEALFDHEAEEEDELNFSAGDMVEVIDKPDGGWWRGRFNGKEGLFPSNYVKS